MILGGILKFLKMFIKIWNYWEFFWISKYFKNFRTEKFWQNFTTREGDSKGRHAFERIVNVNVRTCSHEQKSLNFLKTNFEWTKKPKKHWDCVYVCVCLYEYKRKGYISFIQQKIFMTFAPLFWMVSLFYIQIKISLVCELKKEGKKVFHGKRKVLVANVWGCVGE